MKILFVLYGNFTTNTATPLSRFARELTLLGHECVIAIPSEINTAALCDTTGFKPMLYSEVLDQEGKIFSNDSRADIIHACTPRIGVQKFLQSYLVRWPTPLSIYLEDQEFWIAKNYLGLSDQEILQLTDGEISQITPESLSHYYESSWLISLADVVMVIQERLADFAPKFMPISVIPIGVDLEKFHPEIAPITKWPYFNSNDDDHKVIVYHGGLNQFTQSALLDLCQAIDLMNEAGTRVILVRSGPNPINFWDQLNSRVKPYIFEVGVLDRNEIPSVLALGDIYVQPGRHNEFEEYRLPGKVPEFFAMGRPVVLSSAGIADQFEDEVDAILLKEGNPEEIAAECIKLFRDPIKSRVLGARARAIALERYNMKIQAKKLEYAYEQAITLFDYEQTKALWLEVCSRGYAAAALLKLSLMQSKLGSDSSIYMNQLALWSRLLNERFLSVSSRLNKIEAFPFRSLAQKVKNRILRN
jgi:glycosyltransferase involved in cell wall biosynthesis